MRRPVKVLANFLGAAKELMGEYVDLAKITDDELNQIQHSVVSRTDRKPTVKMLSDKGLSTRQIADITGWSHQTIMRDLGPNGPKGGPNGPATTGGDAKKQHRAEVAAAAAKEGITPAPTENTASSMPTRPGSTATRCPTSLGSSAIITRAWSCRRSAPFLSKTGSRTTPSFSCGSPRPCSTRRGQSSRPGALSTRSGLFGTRSDT